MNWSELHSNWDRMSPLLRTFWPKLSDEDLQQIAGKREHLSALLCQKYGFDADDAERRICAFEDDVRFPGAVK